MSTSAPTAMHAICINIRTEHQPIIWHKIYVLKRYKGVEKLSTLISGCCSCIRSVSLINNSRYLVLLLTSFCVTVIPCVTESFGFELLALPSVALFFDWRWIKNNPKRLKNMYSFLKAFLVLMKLLSLSQFYAPKFPIEFLSDSLHISLGVKLFVCWFKFYFHCN